MHPASSSGTAEKKLHKLHTQRNRLELLCGNNKPEESRKFHS